VFNIGSSLHEARTRQNLDLEEMEQRTKVRAKYLRLLEDERFDQLPGHAYTKGFLQVYANALGLDGRLYVEEYNSRYVTGEDDASPRLPRGPARSPRRRRERRETRTVGVALAAILVVTAFVIAAWRFGGDSLARMRLATRLMQDLEINSAGVALALDLLDRIAELESRLRR